MDEGSTHWAVHRRSQAFPYGTESIKPVDIIVGPGNRSVTEAKRQCYGQVGIDFVAGPSEVLVIADGKASAKVVAADLLAQSEHDVNAKGILLTTDEAFGKSVIEAVEEELKILDTAKIARRSWDTFGEIGVVDSLDEAVQYANEYAPEHLEINVEDPDALIPKLVNYGSLFIGQNTAEVFGDYASGTNHTLPTLRAARYTGGVWVGTFLKTCTHQSMTPEGIRADRTACIAYGAWRRIIWTCSGCGCKKIGKIENNRINPLRCCSI